MTGRIFSSVLLMVLVTEIRAALVISNAPIVANVYEEQNSAITLTTIDCTPLAGSKVTMVSITPGPCSTCFQIYQLDPTKPYELQFLPSQGKLSYAVQSSYNINATCTDLTTTVFTIINVRVRTNEPPRFTVSSSVQINYNAQTAKNGDIIYTVTDAVDPDTDAIFYNMSVQPVSSSNKYEIGLTDGKIRAKADLASECFPTLVLFVFIRDNRSITVGPKVITVQFTAYYTVPYISTLNKQITVPEDFAVLTASLAQIQAQFNSPTVSYSMQTFPAIAASYFVVDDNYLATEHISVCPTARDKLGVSLGFRTLAVNPDQLRLQNKLNFEGGINNINVTIKPINTFCTPDIFFLYITVTDANDNPVLSPRDIISFIYEGKVNFQPGFSYTDEDPGDKSTYKLTAGDTTNFYIDYATGAIQSNNYNIDGSASPIQVVFTVEITDQQGGKDSTTVTLNFLDVNDNPPVFGATSYTATVEDCTPAGKNLGTIVVADAVDTAFNGNNVCECIPVTNGFINVLSTCDVLLNASIPANSVTTLYVSATDKGTVPGPLTVASPVPFIVTSTPCSITTTTTPGPTTTTPTTTVPTTTPMPTVFGLNSLVSVNATNGDNGTGNMPWIVVGCIVACIGIACAAFVISRYVVPKCKGNGAKPSNERQPRPGSNQYRNNNTQRNNVKPVTPREVHPYEAKQGPDAYRLQNGPGPEARGQNVWQGIGNQPDKAFEL